MSGGIFLVLAWVIFYGFTLNFPPCNYTEEDLPVVADLKEAVFTLEKDASVVRGSDSDYSCVESLQGIRNDIWSSENIKSIRSFYERKGRTVESLPRGKRFTLQKTVAVTKHGISTIDSGPGPIEFLILKDEEGELYQATPGGLGFDDKSSVMSFRNSTTQGTMSYMYFYHYLESLPK